MILTPKYRKLSVGGHGPLPRPYPQCITLNTLLTFDHSIFCSLQLASCCGNMDIDHIVVRSRSRNIVVTLLV